MKNALTSSSCCMNKNESSETPKLKGNSRWGLAGAVIGALGASICCILPVAVGFLGFGSAALGVTLAPLRPYFLGWAVFLLGISFYLAYRPGKAECAPGQSCAVPENQRQQRIALWVAAIMVLALGTFPYYGWIVL